MGIGNDIIKQLGRRPSVASEIYNKLEKRHSRTSLKAAMSRLVAQKKIFRAKLNLPHNDSILSLENDFSNPLLIKELLDTDFYGRQGLSNLVRHLISSAPSVSLVDIAKLTASRIGKEPNLDWSFSLGIIEALQELGILKKREDVEEWYLNKALLTQAKIPFNKENLAYSNIASIEKLRYLQIEAISEWLSHNGFVSFNGSHVAGESRPVVSGYGLAFDFLGFSFINGVIERKKSAEKSKPLSLLGDVLVGVCNIAYARSFKLRINEVGGITKKTPMGFILAKGFTKDAFEFLKNEGIHAWAFDKIFGKSSAKAVENILDISREIAKGENTKPEKIAEALDQADSFGDLLGNMKGQLFELLIAYYVSRDGFGSLHLGKKIPQGTNPSNKYELDVMGIKNRSAVFFECKGIKKGNAVDHEEVKKHFQKRTPSARDYIQQKFTGENVESYKSILVTTGDFSKETIEDFEKMKSRHDTSFELWNRAKLVSVLKSAGHSVLIDIIKKYY